VPILTDDIIQFVNRTKLGFVATVCADGSPNLSPKGTTVAWDDEHILFADIHSPGTIQNLLANPAIEINVVDIFTRKGYRFKGHAIVYSNGKVFDDVVEFYRNAGSEHKIQNVVLTKVQQVLAISSPAYDAGLSEQEITNKWIEYWNVAHASLKSPT
jgi:predicted pyridoxine 5'-phosphate oxidase superfamily flavin-nucleotide-binding protein